MQQLINKHAEKTLRIHTSDLDLLVKTNDVIEDFFIGEGMTIDAHILKITNGKYSRKADLGVRYRRSIEVADQHNTILNIFPDLWEELGEAIRNLIISNYRSVFRSLRWIIESVVFWADIELDKEINDAISHFNNYYQNESMSKENYSFLSEYVLRYNSDLMNDRLYTKEKDRKHGFQDSLDNLKHLKKDGYENIVTKIQHELRTLYHDFSAFTHISIESLRREKANPEYYPYSMYYVYGKESFHSTLEKIWKVIDLITFIMLLMCSRFYGYKLTHEYLDAMKAYYKNRRYNATNKFIKHVTFARKRMQITSSLLGKS